MTQGEYVSRVLNTLKLLNKDEHISRRFILATIKSIAKRELSRKMDRRGLYSEPGIFSWVNCFELERKDVVTCNIVEFRTSKRIMKSKKQLPELITNDYGSSIKLVTTLDGDDSIDYVDFAQIIRNNKRQYKIVGKSYFTIIDNYLYLIDSNYEAVNVLLASLNVDEINEAAGCSTCDECQSAWDYELPIPPRMADFVVQETINLLLSTTRQIVQDENPNLDSNIKSQTTE